jgi:pimeloyl-ACP methyl ester carboxylesterase
MLDRTLFVNGAWLAFREWPGAPGAPPVLCLPHLTAHKGSFDRLAAGLAPRYHVYALDLRGRGDSDRPANGYGFAGHAQDILGLAEALGLARFAIVGHSFGATAAVYLASVFPARVSALALLDGGADPKEETLRAMYATVRRLDHLYPSVDAYLAAMRAQPFFQPWNPALEAYFGDDVAIGPDGAVTSKSSASAIERDLTLHFDYSMCLHFPNLRCPVLFLRPALGLRGERGHVFSDAEAAAITRHIPDCRQAVLAGVNHYTMLIHDRSPAFEAVRGFLDEVIKP